MLLIYGIPPARERRGRAFTPIFFATHATPAKKRFIKSQPHFHLTLPNQPPSQAPRSKKGFPLNP
jgi:hypothetical protein